MIFDFAVALNRLPSEFMRDCSSMEYTYLKQYYRLEPFGAWRDNYHAAQITQILANVHRGKRKRPFQLSDFFYRDKTTERNARHRSFFGAFKSKAVKKTAINRNKPTEKPEETP